MPDPITVLLAASSLLLALASLGLAVVWRRSHQQALFAGQAVIALQRELAALAGSARERSRRTNAIQAQVERLVSRVDSVEYRAPSAQSFNRAIHLAHQGQSTEELVQRCGLSQAEAELVISLHQPEGRIAA